MHAARVTGRSSIARSRESRLTSKLPTGGSCGGPIPTPRPPACRAFFLSAGRGDGSSKESSVASAVEPAEM
eukprot:scaffold2723_cov108-Isochrysis_galbana.AAC.19